MSHGVLSAFARREADLWDEATPSAWPPNELATTRLASLIVDTPGALLAHLEPRRSPSGLMALLPRQTGAQILSHGISAHAGLTTNARSANLNLFA